MFFINILKTVAKACLLYVAIDPSVETDGNKYSPLQHLFLVSSFLYRRSLQPAKFFSAFSSLLPLASANGFSLFYDSWL
jgi:hypothetical protein